MAGLPYTCEYALYKGEKLLAIGTIPEIAEKLNVKMQTVRKYMTPSYRRCLESQNISHENARILVKLTDED